MTLVMFDMDGTLIDTEALIAEHMAATFVGAGLQPPTPAESRRVIGLSLPIALARLANNDDPAVVDRLVTDYRTNFHASLLQAGDREPMFPGALEALHRLHARDDVSLGIATGKGLKGVHRFLEHRGVSEYFVTLQTPDHNPSKPNPGMLLRAMAETGATPAETIMVGDTTFDIEMGKAAGAKAIGVTWGYHDPAELIAAGADIMIDHYSELDAAIEKLVE